VFAQNERREEFKNIVHQTCKHIDTKLILSLLKSLTLIGSGLVSPKEFQDFFIDIYENVIQPLAKLKLKEEEVKLFLNTLLLALSKMKKMNAFVTTWQCYMSVVREFYMVLYPNAF
jgi:transcriptional antiterminator